MKDLIEELSRILKYKYKDILEVDLILYDIFSMLSESEYFIDNFLLKGGTCLIKNYLNYYRFSEDIDLTWKNQEIFNDKSKSKKRKIRSQIITKLGVLIERICKDLDSDFKSDKRNERYYHFSGNSMVNLKLYYTSEILKIERVLKIELVLFESLKFPPKMGTLRSIITDNEELRFLFPQEYKRYSNNIKIPIYNINEILCEKVRAILTRKVIKGRDLIDIYYILKKYKLVLHNFKAPILEKTLNIH